MAANRHPGEGGPRRWWLFRRSGQRREADQERIIDDLRSRLDEVRQQLADAEQRAASANSRAETAESEVADMRRELALAASVQQPVPVVTPPPPAAISPRDGPGEPPAVATRLLFITDRLSDFMAADAAADPQRAGVMVQWINGQIPELLGDCGVTAFDDDGPLDPARHEVVDVRPAPAPDQAGRIAETLRPGYEWHGDLLRAQRVVTYAAGER